MDGIIGGAQRLGISRVERIGRCMGMGGAPRPWNFLAEIQVRLQVITQTDLR